MESDGTYIRRLAWRYDGCPWDRSGVVRETAERINPEMKLYDFLDTEYTGRSTATYEPGCGLRWNTYGDDIAFDTLEFAESIMRKCFAGYFTELNGDEEFYAADEIHDEIYDNCWANEFFGWECIFGSYDKKMIGLSEDITLNQFLEKRFCIPKTE